MEAPAREKLGKYEIVRTLGSGAMGVVYLAFDPVIHRQVALKTIRKDRLEDPKAAERFRREAMAAGRLTHPGIVGVYDYGEDESTAYIVLEYVAGENLGEFVRRRGGVSLQEIRSLMGELCDALQYAHDSGVVHRDIKPENLLIAGRLKITDFGVARVMTSAKLTRSGAAVGTPHYMAPEQYSGGAIDRQADIFAAGVVLYEMLTGALPFPGDLLHEIAYKVCHTEPTAPTRLVPTLPAAIDGVIAGALAKKKTERFGSALDLWRALDAALAGATSAPAEPPRWAAAAVATTIAASPWTPEMLKALEATLLTPLGPLAGPLVQRSARKTADPGDLLSLLVAGFAPGEPPKALVAKLRTTLGIPAPGERDTAVDASGERPRPFAQQDLDRLSQALAGFIGPIARILVQKTAAGARSYPELCAKLAERLGSDDERARFLRQVDAG